MWASDNVKTANSNRPKLLFPTAVPRIPIIAGSADHEKKRKIAIKCLELEEMLESKGLSQSEIELKVASFRALLLRQVANNNNNNNNSPNNVETNIDAVEKEEKENEQKLNNGHSSKSDTNSEKTGSSKKKKKRRKESKHRKKKKEKRKHYCSSPSYSDYEPDNPLLKNKRRYEIYWGFTPVKPSNILWHILCYFGY